MGDVKEMIRQVDSMIRRLRGIRQHLVDMEPPQEVRPDVAGEIRLLRRDIDDWIRING